MAVWNANPLSQTSQARSSFGKHDAGLGPKQPWCWHRESLGAGPGGQLTRTGNPQAEAAVGYGAPSRCSSVSEYVCSAAAPTAAAMQGCSGLLTGSAMHGLCSPMVGEQGGI